MLKHSQKPGLKTWTKPLSRPSQTLDLLWTSANVDTSFHLDLVFEMMLSFPCM